MTDLTLSLTDGFWTVGNELIDKLNKLVTRPIPDIAAGGDEQYSFPEEILAQAEVDWIQGHIDHENNELDKYKQVATHLYNLKMLYKEKNQKETFEKQKQETMDLETTLKQELNRVQESLKNFNTDDEAPQSETYKQLQKKQAYLNEDLPLVQERLTFLDDSIDAFSGVGDEIRLENQRLRMFRQNNFGVDLTDNITSLTDVFIQEKSNQENQQWQEQVIKKLHVEKNTADTKKENIEDKYAPIRAKMQKPLVALTAQQQLADTDKNDVDFEVLHEAMKNMADVTPGIYKEIIQGVAQNATAAEFDKKRQVLKQDMTEKFKNAFSDGGSTHQIQVEVEVGAGVSAGIISAKATLIASLALTVTKDNNGKLSVKKSLVGGIKAKGKAGIGLSQEQGTQLKAAISAKLANESSKTYDKLDDFIEGEAANTSSAFLDYSLSKNVIPAKQYQNLRVQQKAVAQQEAAIVDKQELEKKLRLTGLLKTAQQLTVPGRTEISYVRTNNTSASGDAKASLAVRFANSLGVGGSYKRVIGYSQSYKQKTIHLIDDVAEHPTLGKLYGMKQPQSFGFVLKEDTGEITYSGEEAIKKLNDIEAQIDAYQDNADAPDKAIKLATLRNQLKGALEKLSVEYQMFVQAENKTAQDGNSEEKSLRNSLRYNRGAKDSGNYLKAVSLQYVNLRKAYDKSFLENESINEDDQTFMDDFEKDLKSPKFKLPDNYAKIFNIDQNTPLTEVSTEEKVVAIESKVTNTDLNNLNATAPGIQLGVKYTKTITPDKEENGEVSLTFNITSEAKGANFVAKLLQSSDLKKMTKMDADEKEVSDSILAALKSMATGNLEVKLHRKKHGWHVKYVRGYEVSAKTAGLKGTVANIGGVNLIAGGTVSTTHISTIYEKPGVDSLSYITDIYRAKKIRTKGPDDWAAYDKKYDLLENMVNNIKTEGSNISIELEDWLTELAASDASENEEMVKKTRTGLALLRAGGDAGDFKDTFVALVAKKTAQEDEKLKKQFQTRRTAQHKDMQEYAQDFIERKKRNIAETHGLTGSNATSVDNLLTWAKQRYNRFLGERNAAYFGTELDAPDKLKTPTQIAADAALQKSFETLKSVFGLQYADKTLDELMNSEKSADQNKALTLLDNQLDAMLDESSKVYLDEGLSGELTMDAEGKLKIKPIVAQGNKKSFIEDAITARVASQMNGVDYNALPATRIDDRGVEESLPKVSSKSNKSQQANVSRLRRMMSRQKTISDDMVEVMEDQFKKGKQQNSMLKRVKSMLSR